MILPLEVKFPLAWSKKIKKILKTMATILIHITVTLHSTRIQ